MFRWNQKRPDEAAPTPALPDDDVVTTSKVFPRFLSAVRQQETPALVDLGPIVGSNVAYFGERLACKLYVEDLFADVETCARRGGRQGLDEAFAARLQLPAESIDGVLCWDLFDFIDPASGRALAVQLARLLRQGGALYGFFGTTPIDLKSYTRYIVEAEDRFRLKPYPATPVKRGVLLTRDINKMFAGLNVTESVLLKTSTRETLFRKP